MKKNERGSLLPHTSIRSQPLARSKTSSQRSNPEPAKSHSNAHYGRSDDASTGRPQTLAPSDSLPIDAIQEDNGGLVPRKQVSRIQPPANIGKPISLRDQGGRSATQSCTQRAPSIKCKDQPVGASRIAAPRIANEDTPKSGATKNEPSRVSSPFLTSRKLDIEARKVDDHRSDSIVEKPRQNRKASIARSNSAVSRPIRSNSQQSSARALSRSKRPLSIEPVQTSTASKGQRPAFSTMQQHFTPRKSSKATTASFLLQPSTKQATDDTLSAEAIYLQKELVQLHLLHQSSSATQSQWEQSAKAYFEHELQQLSRQRAELETEERHNQASINYPALAEWSQSVSSVEFAERIQILSRNLHEICSVLDAGGKYERVIGVFEVWVTCASRIRSSRRNPTQDNKADLEFVEDIGDGWKAEVAYLERKLTISSQELQGLGKPREGSSIAHVLSLLKGTVASMLEELAAIKAIERDLAILEAKWMESEVAKIAQGIGDEADASDSLPCRGV